MSFWWYVAAAPGPGAGTGSMTTVSTVDVANVVT